MSPVIPAMASIVAMSLDQISGSSASACSDQCTLLAANHRTSDHAGRASDQRTFQFAMTMPSIVPAVPSLPADASDNSNHHDHDQ